VPSSEESGVSARAAAERSRTACDRIHSAQVVGNEFLFVLGGKSAALDGVSVRAVRV